MLKSLSFVKLNILVTSCNNAPEFMFLLNQCISRLGANPNVGANPNAHARVKADMENQSRNHGL